MTAQLGKSGTPESKAAYDRPIAEWHLGNHLMGALPNATYLGFTGTPMDRTAYGKGTFKVFGAQDEKGFLDKYTIRESVADGTTVPLHYALAPNDLRVDRPPWKRSS